MCQVVLDNYICVDPLDKTSKKFQEKEKSCREVYELILSKFNNQHYALPKDFNDDLPLHICEYLHTELIDKLVTCRKFKNNQFIRDKVKENFHIILKPFSGPNTINTK